MSSWVGRLAGLAAMAATPAFGQDPPPVVATPPTAEPPPAVAANVPPPVEIPQLTNGQMAIALKVLREADAEGLPSRLYVPADPADQVAVVKGLVAYAHDVRVGRMAPEAFPTLWSVRPAPYDPAPGLAKALTEDRLQQWLDAQRPPYSGYHALKRGLARYREIAAGGGWKPIPAGAPIGLGAKDPRVAAIRERLAAEDAQVAAAGGFDKNLQDAVVRAQRRFGLKPDGVVGKDLIAYLNQPVGQRVLQTIANMERWRWLPAEMPATRVQANSGAAIVTLFRDDKPVLSMKAVSGRPGDETPMLMSAIHSVVINPPWNVPTSIATKELFPKGPGYLAANGFTVISTPEGGKRLQQRAGPKAALGLFKFDFENPFSVYLHDTPTKGTFDQYARNASHGCVRLEHARVLAEALLTGDPVWTPDKIDEQLAVGKTVRVPLSERVPVFIFYWTAFAGPDGTMNFRADPYDWDRLLLQKTGVLTG